MAQNRSERNRRMVKKLQKLIEMAQNRKNSLKARKNCPKSIEIVKK
jgi:hypothetical protein